MALDTFSGLKSAIESYVGRTDLSAYLPIAISLAEADIGRKLRVWQMESLETLNATSGESDVELPSRCRDVKWVKITGTEGRLLTRLPAASSIDDYAQATTGTPGSYYFEENHLVLVRTPSSDIELAALCILAPQALSDSNTTNTILTNYPDVYFYGALKHVFAKVRNQERKAEAAQDFEKAVAEANMESRKIRASGVPSGIRTLGRGKIV